MKEGLKMKYHNITHDDMLNGEGLRVVLWLSGCDHRCEGCQNTITHDYESGLIFDDNAKKEIFNSLEKDYVSGLTLSGGDPLFTKNRSEVINFILEVKRLYPTKNIWLYTGYTFEEVIKWNFLKEALEKIDVLVDGKFIPKLADTSYHWAGSTNQRVIDTKETLTKGAIVLYENNKKRWHN